jgi:putative redox protein
MEIRVRSLGGLRTEAGDGSHTVLLDEPIANGGEGTALTPRQVLLSSLGACTAMTLRIYAGRKGWPLGDVSVRVLLDEAPGTARRITQELTLGGPLDESQRSRLLEIAGRCPVHRLLEGPTEFEERLGEPLPARG